MAVASRKIEKFTANGQSTITILDAIIFTSTQAADVASLLSGGSGGTTLITYKQPTALATIAQTFPDGGVQCPEGAWYVAVTTNGIVTLIGD